MSETAELVPQAALKARVAELKASGCNVLVDLTCVDFQGFGAGTKNASPAPEGRRFKLVYRLMELDLATGMVKRRLTLDSWVEDGPGPVSVMSLFPNADWLEREVWDMFGVAFADRPDIKRILMYPEFTGHPLRKDYPIKERQPLIGPADGPARERMTAADLRPRLL